MAAIALVVAAPVTTWATYQWRQAAMSVRVRALQASLLPGITEAEVRARLATAEIAQASMFERDEARDGVFSIFGQVPSEARWQIWAHSEPVSIDLGNLGMIEVHAWFDSQRRLIRAHVSTAMLLDCRA